MEKNNGSFRALFRYDLDRYLRFYQSFEFYRCILYVFKLHCIQNEIINVAGKQVMMNIVECVNQSGSFSFIADKSLDVSDIKNFLKCARFFGKVDKEYVIRKDFLCCILVQNVTEKNL